MQIPANAFLRVYSVADAVRPSLLSQDGGWDEQGAHLVLRRRPGAPLGVQGLATPAGHAGAVAVVHVGAAGDGAVAPYGSRAVPIRGIPAESAGAMQVMRPLQWPSIRFSADWASGGRCW
jgi:hypothetical protein